MAELTCTVVTPELTALETKARMVIVPLYDGELGIAYNHSPMIGRLGYGELRITDEGGKVNRYYVDGGFVQVQGNVVSVLTGKAIKASELDGAVAREQLQTAQKKPATTDELLAIRERLVAQARAQIRLTSKR